MSKLDQKLQIWEEYFPIEIGHIVSIKEYSHPGYKGRDREEPDEAPYVEIKELDVYVQCQISEQENFLDLLVSGETIQEKLEKMPEYENIHVFYDPNGVNLIASLEQKPLEEEKIKLCNELTLEYFSS